VNVIVLTPEKTLLEEKMVESMRMPLADGGSIGIRPGHHPLLAETRNGNLVYTRGSETNQLSLRAGILRVDAQGVTVYTNGLTSDSDEQDDESTRLDAITDELEEKLEEGF